MEVRVRPVVYDFLSLSAGSGVSSPGFRGLSICVCSTAQGNYWRGQTEGSAGNNDTEKIMTQYNTVAWKWLSYHQGYHMSGNVVTAIWKTSTPPSEETHDEGDRGPNQGLWLLSPISYIHFRNWSRLFMASIDRSNNYTVAIKATFTEHTLKLDKNVNLSFK